MKSIGPISFKFLEKYIYTYTYNIAKFQGDPTIISDSEKNQQYPNQKTVKLAK